MSIFGLFVRLVGGENGWMDAMLMDWWFERDGER